LIICFPDSIADFNYRRSWGLNGDASVEIIFFGSRIFCLGASAEIDKY